MYRAPAPAWLSMPVVVIVHVPETAVSGSENEKSFGPISPRLVAVVEPSVYATPVGETALTVTGSPGANPPPDANADRVTDFVCAYGRGQADGWSVDDVVERLHPRGTIDSPHVIRAKLGGWYGNGCRERSVGCDG